VLASAAVGRYAYQKYNQGKASAAAASRRQLENTTILSEFLAGFPSINGESVELQRSALTRAAELNDLPLVKLLIEAGADVNQKLSAGVHAGRDALFFAAYYGRSDIVKALLDAGANNFDDALAAIETHKRNNDYPRKLADAEYQAVTDLLAAAKIGGTS